MPSLTEMLAAKKKAAEAAIEARLAAAAQPAVAVKVEAPIEPPKVAPAPVVAPPQSAAKIGGSMLKAALAGQKPVAKPQVSQPPMPPKPPAQVATSAAPKPEPPKPNGAIIPATPADPGISDPVIAELKANIAYVSAHIEEKELIQQVTRKILEQIQKAPHLAAVLTNVEENAIVRAVRRCFAVAAMKKVEGKEKKEKKKAEFSELDAMMKDFDDVKFG